MSALDQLRSVVDEERDRLRAEVPAHREDAIRALLRAIDGLPAIPGVDEPPDLVSGRHFVALGANLALRLCLEAPELAADDGASAAGLDSWASCFLERCGWLTEAELVLGHVETGFMRLVANEGGEFSAWIATKRIPASWRERADVDWWAGWLARQREPELRAVEAAGTLADDAVAATALGRRRADTYLQTMVYQMSYPADADLGGCTMQTYRDVLSALLARALLARDRGADAQPQSALTLRDALAAQLAIEPETADIALAGFTLDRENAAYHAAAPGVALPPLVQLAPDRLVWSWRGLTTEPFFFLMRELRRRDAQEYHNSAHLREGVFRDDLYALFADKRFVTSAGRIVLRRAVGDARTDVDAAVFDRKSGALALFELKSQDPFARSTAELTRQRDNVLYANRQIGGMLDWIKRHGADEILNRLDRQTAKTFRVQKVFPFVLGRYLAQFNDGPEPDRRAAWGAWPRLLRLRAGQRVAASEASPLQSLFTRLKGENEIGRLPGDLTPREIVIGTARLTVYPSYGALREGTGS